MGEWMRYKGMSPWKDSKMWEDNRPMWKKMVWDIYSYLPNWLSIRVVALFQVYRRPLYFKIAKNLWRGQCGLITCADTLSVLDYYITFDCVATPELGGTA